MSRDPTGAGPNPTGLHALAVVGLYGYLQADKAAVVGAAQKAVWLWAIPAAGALICLAWVALLASYRQINRAKFEVLKELERDLPASLFAREQVIYRAEGRRSLSRVERWITALLRQAG